MRSAIVFAGFFAVCAAFTTSALADAPPVDTNAVRDAAKEEAKREFARGKTAFEAGDYATALGAFKHAEDLVPSPNLYFNIGLAYERMGDNANAVRAYKKFFALRPELTSADEVKFQLELKDRMNAMERALPPKIGRWSLDVKLGVSALLYQRSGNEPAIFSFVLQGGYSLWKEQLYLILPFSIEHTSFNTGLDAAGNSVSPGLTKVIVPIGLQWDIPTPVRGLFVTASFAAGYGGLFLDLGVDGSYSAHGVAMLPQAGIKYVIARRVNLGIEPLGFPIFVYKEPTIGTTVGGWHEAVEYRCLFSGGVNF